MDLPTPKLDEVCTLQVELDPIREMGAGRAGHRRIIPIVGGTVTGRASVWAHPEYWCGLATIFAGGLAELDTRYAMETDDGAVIEIINYGFRHGPEEVLAAVARGEQVDPAAYYMRTHARLETGDARYDWVNQTLFVGVGARFQQAVQVTLYEMT